MFKYLFSEIALDIKVDDFFFFSCNFSMVDVDVVDGVGGVGGGVLLLLVQGRNGKL